MLVLVLVLVLRLVLRLVQVSKHHRWYRHDQTQSTK
jgi:hypothetical protein